MKVKRIYIPFKTKEIEPKLFTLVFKIDGTQYNSQVVAYDLESAVGKAYVYGKELTLQNLFWNFSISLDEIKDKFKRV